MTRARWIWGVDPAISHVAFAFADAASPGVDVKSLRIATDATEGERLGLLDRQIRIFARQAADQNPPAVVWVEQPSGRFANLQLAYATGVIQAALHEALEVPVWTIPSSAWKKRTVGVGNATKEQVAAWVGKVAHYDCQDEADAIAIACAGRAMLAAGRWDAAA